MLSFTKSCLSLQSRVFTEKIKNLYLLVFILFLTTEIYPQWVLTNAPKGIPIYSFASSGQNVFAGGDTDSYVDFGGSVFLSTNNGADWTDVSNGLNCPEIRALAIVDTFIFAASYGGGVFLSTNNGSNWTNVNNGLTGFEVYAFAASDSNLFAGTNDGIFITTDRGKNWKQIAWDNQYVMTLTAYDTNLFAGAFYSSDNGVNWKNVGNGLTDLPVWALASSGSNVFALTNWGSIFLTTNNGENWTLINEEKRADAYEVKWNAANLPSGVYFYQLKAGNFTATKKLLLMK